MLLLTRYELARVIGIRSLQLSEGDTCKVTTTDPNLCLDFFFMSGLELYLGLLDICVKREDKVHHISEFRMPVELRNMLLMRGGTVFTEMTTSSSP